MTFKGLRVLSSRLLPDDVAVLDGLVTSLIDQGRVGEAVPLLKEGVRRSPDSARLASALA